MKVPAAVAIGLLLIAAPAAAQRDYPSGYGNQPKPGVAAAEKPPQIREVTFEQRLDEMLPLVSYEREVDAWIVAEEPART